jgi:hypothetical protein
MYLRLVRAQPEYSPIACNSVTCTAAGQPESGQQHLLSTFHLRYFSHLKYASVLEYLKFPPLCVSMCQLDARFLIDMWAYSGLKRCSIFLNLLA